MKAVSQITRLASIFEDFMYHAYAEFLEDNVQYIEFRTGLGPKCKVRQNDSGFCVMRANMACVAGNNGSGLLPNGLNGDGFPSQACC